MVINSGYRRDLEDGHGEFVQRHLSTCKRSVPGRAFYFETYLPDYGALYDKLPISAFVSKPVTPTPDMDLYNLQFWNCMDYGVVAIHKQFIGSMDFEILTRDHGTMMGQLYLLHLDNYHVDPDVVDYSTSEKPSRT